MVDIKEITGVKITPFALMSSSIHAVLAFIAAIIIVLTFGLIAALIPGASLFAAFISLLGIGIIILYPLTAFFVNILYTFVVALLYNGLAGRVGGIKLGMEGDEVRSIPVVPAALILSCISAIITFIVGLYMGLGGSVVLSLISGIIPLAASSTGNATIESMFTGAGMGALSGMWAVFWIILYPIVAFIMTFIVTALFAIFYNIIIPKIGGMKLIFAESGDAFELTNIPAVPLALSLSVVIAVLGAIYGFIIGVLTGDIVAAIIMLIMYAISWFIMYFIIFALAALIYNFLQTKIGGIKLMLQ
ncbi:MAG: hypothetical protein HVN35_10265 [Methanobacteriaceae archaeon]|nr:hypothetical protein [Methanobacteriaceae archaeon]